jgi:hypothetical protein
MEALLGARRFTACRSGGLFEVASAGGVPSPLPGVGQHRSNELLFSPVLLPDRQHFLYVQGALESNDVYLGSLNARPGQNAKKLLSGAGLLAYAPSPDNPDLGYLLFQGAAGGSSGPAFGGTLMAQSFNLRKLDLAGEPAPVAEQVDGFTFSASLTGTLVYQLRTETERLLTVFDRQGKVTGTVGEGFRAPAYEPRYDPRVRDFKDGLDQAATEEDQRTGT